MTTRVTVSTKGFEEYLEQLAQAGADVDEAAAAALNAGADVAVDGMRRRVPVDTGNLRDHLGKTEVVQDGNYLSLLVGVIEPDEETARYGNAQEYGTSSMAAQPYIRPTMAEDAGKIKKAMRDSLIEDGKL